MKFTFTTRTVPKVMFANCGHGITRRIEDCKEFKFISAGQGDVEKRDCDYFGRQIRNLIVGDILCVYRNRIGYVGIAKVISKPMNINEASLGGKMVTKETPFHKDSKIFRNHDKPCFMEWLVEVKWLTDVYINDQQRPYPYFGIFAKQHATCSLDNQPKLKDELQKVFKINFNELL